MARVPCDLADILLAVPANLVAAGVATAPQTYLSLDPDDVPSGTVAPPLFAASFTAFDQRGDSVESESDWNDCPYVEGELVVTVWTRVPLDPAARDTAALTKASLGLAGLVRRVMANLNNVDLTSGSDTITARSLTFLGTRNKGKWGKDKDWRRLDVRFSCAFNWNPLLPPITVMIGTSQDWSRPAGSTITKIECFGDGGGGAGVPGNPGDIISAGGGGGYIRAVPANNPATVTIVVAGGGSVNTNNTGSVTQVSWDAAASYVSADGGQGGSGSGAGGTSSSAGNVLSVTAFHGGQGDVGAIGPSEGGPNGGGGAGSAGNGATGAAGGSGGTPDGGNGDTGGAHNGGPNGGGGTVANNGTPMAGWPGLVRITYQPAR